MKGILKECQVEYTLRVPTASCGDVIPLFLVAEAMAGHAARGYGTLPPHLPSFKNLKSQRIALLLDAANNGQLTVCDWEGRIANAEELINAFPTPVDWKSDDSSERDIFPLCVKAQHLIKWGDANCDVFRIVDAPVEVVEFDLKNEAGEVIEVGYFRGFVGSLPVLSADVSGSVKLSKTAPVNVDDVPTKRKAKKPSIEKVAFDYMRKEYLAGHFQSAAKFHKHLIQTAGEKGSPFEMGTGSNARKLFCPAASSFYDAGTLGKIWAKIRSD